MPVTGGREDPGGIGLLRLPEGKTFGVLARYGDWLAVIILIAVVLVLSLPKIRGPIDLRYDGSVYYILGTSLAQGDGYRLLNEPGAIEAVQYPPLLPAFIALTQLLLDSDDPFVVGQALRITYHVLYLVLVLLAYALARRFVGTGIAFLVGLLTALNSYSYYLADLCFTEIPYTALTMGFLLCAGMRMRWSNLSCGVMAAAAYLTRTSGLALLAAWVLDALLERRFRAVLLRGAIAAIPVIAWQIYVERVKASDEFRTPAYEYQRAPYLYNNVTYAENLSLVDPFRPENGMLDLKEAMKRAVYNVQFLPLTLGEGASLPLRAWKWNLIKVRVLTGESIGWFLWKLLEPFFILIPLAIGGLVLIGSIPLASGRERLPGLYLLLSVGLLTTTCWPRQNLRYLLPLAPLLVLALVHGTTLLINRMKMIFIKVDLPRSEKLIIFGLTIIGIIQAFTAAMTYTLEHSYVLERDRNGPEHKVRYFDFDSSWQGLWDSMEWIGNHSRPDSIIASTSPHLLYLRTGRTAVMPPFEPDRNRCLDLLDGVPVDYVIIDKLKFLDVGERYAEPAVQSAFDRWRIVYEDSLGRVRIYGRIKPSG